MRTILSILLLTVMLANPVAAEPDTPFRRVASYTLPATPATTLVVPYVSNGHLGIYSAVRLLNTSEDLLANVDLSYRDATGTQVHRHGTILPPHGSALFSPSGYGDLPAGFQGSLTITSNRPLVAVTLYDVPDWSGDGLMACPASTGLQLPQAIPGVEQSAASATTLAIRNAGSGATTATISLYAADGTPSAQTTQPLSADGSVAIPLSDLIDPNTSFYGTVLVSASQALAINALQLRPAEQLAECSPASPALALILPKAGPESHYLPRISKGDGGVADAPRWLTFNPATSESTGAMYYRDSDGEGQDEELTIPARQTLTRLLDDTALPTPWWGAGTYDVSSSQAVRVQGSAVLSATRPYLASYGSSAANEAVWLPAFRQAPGVVQTQLAVQNAADGTLTFDALFFDVLGTASHAGTGAIESPGVRFYGAGSSLFSGLPADFRGAAKLSSSNQRPMAVVASVVATQPLVTSGCSASDLDGDGLVGVDDLQRFAAAWDTLQGQPGYSRTLDLNDNGLVDLLDLTMAAEWWNSLC